MYSINSSYPRRSKPLTFFFNLFDDRRQCLHVYFGNAHVRKSMKVSQGLGEKNILLMIMKH